MKQQTTELILERPSVQLVFLLWKKYKGYGSEFPHVGHYIELLDAFSTNHKMEMSDGRFFSHLLLNAESSVGWEGEELIDILHYETVEIIKRRLNK
jgi:hypothetical protein